MSDLITVDQLASQTGATKIHIAYLTKLGLLPNAIKRKINGQIQGCYPENSIATVLEIQNRKNQGVTYSQLARIPSEVEGPSTPTGINLHVKPSNFAYLVLGLVIGVLVSTLNTSGLAAMKQTSNVSLGQTVALGNKPDDSNVYLIAIPKQNLDNLGKTNINYLIKN